MISRIKPSDRAAFEHYRQHLDLSNFPRGSKKWYENASADERLNWCELRFLCLKYPRFLGGYVQLNKLGDDHIETPDDFVPIMGMDFQEQPHELLFKQFIQFRPGEGFVLSDLSQTFKKFMVLWSRGLFKTSSIIVLIVQTILNYPNVRICFLTGGDTLAKRQEARVKRVFEKPTTMFRWLFPEYCLKSVRNRKVADDESPKAWTDEPARLGTAHEFTVPARTNDTFAEPTFAISTAKSVKAGSHFDLFFVDDLVNEMMNVDEIIPTPKGFVRNGDLQDGDLVFGPDGGAYPILAHPIRTEKAYRVSFDDNTSVLVHGGHLWTTWDFNERRALVRNSSARRIGSQVRRTDDLLKTVRYRKKGHKSGFGTVANHAVVMPAPVEMPEKNLLIPPYALGVWLGDGSSKQSNIAGNDPEIFERLKAFGVYSKKLKTSKKAVQMHGLYFDPPTCKKRRRVNRFTQALKTLGVFNNKHIPTEYLWSSKTQRLELLRGLMDTDGCCSSQHGLCIFVNTNKNLADGVYFLAASLGLKPYQSDALSLAGQKLNSWYPGGVPTYRVTWTSPCPVFGLQRKLDKLPNESTQSKWRYITNIEETDQSIPMRCITSEQPEGLYLFGRNFNVTHNTNYRSPAALEKCYQDYLDMCPLLDPVGFMILTGTRYSFGDTYERIQEKAKEEEQQLGRSIWHFSIRDCWDSRCKTCSHRDSHHDRDKNIIEPPCSVEGCGCRGYETDGSKEVLFPQVRTRDGRQVGHTLDFLEGEKVRLGPEMFANQYENKPIATGTQVFTDDLIKSRTLHDMSQIPDYLGGMTFMVGDLAYVGQPGRDFSVIYICRLFMGRIYVFDCDYGNWDSDAIAKTTIQLMRQHRPTAIYYEKFNGWDAYNNVILAKARELAIDTVPLQWLKGSQSANAKLIRIGAVKGPLAAGRLWLYAAMKGYTKVAEQLLKWPKLGKHDDFADCLGMVMECPTGYQLDAPPPPSSATRWFDQLNPKAAGDDYYSDHGAGSGINCG